MIRLPSTFLPFLVSFLHLLLFVSAITTAPKILCIDKEKNALLDFKLSFVKDTLGNISTWSIDNVDCCTWGGVDCDAQTGHVISLSLSGLESHKLRPSLLELQYLTTLTLSFNRISGSLLETLQYLPSSLTSLDLSSNILNGIISDSHFSKFSMLSYLDISDNNLLEFNFSKSWIPPFQLSTFNSRSCKVGPSFPNWILTQKRLQNLDISNSMISGAIPDAFWDYSTRLYHLDLSHNNISSIIPNSNKIVSPLIRNSSMLTDQMYMDLSYNSFHGAIPSFLFGVHILDLSNNRFTSFSPFDMTTVLISTFQIINLSRNCLSGSLPIWLFEFPRLYALNLADNKLSGNLPEEIGFRPYLFALHLRNNSFSGELPLSLQKCNRLSILDLASNKFTGVVPSWLGENMPNLIALTLSSNNFTGELPSTLCHLQSLQILDLSDNQISGCIPTCLNNFTAMSINKSLSLADYFGGYNLAYFNPKGNDKYVDYASAIWKGVSADFDKRGLDQRNVINLSGNLLRGEIPDEVTALKQLRSLDLSTNVLNGSIPDEIGQMTSLEVLLLSSNRLGGGIPESLAGLTFLDILNLSNNNISGRIPTSTQLQSFKASSYAGNPMLCGDPLPTRCPGDEDGDTKHPLSSKNAHDEDDGSFDIQAFLAALGMGFAFSLLVVLGILHFNRQWRISFFRFVDDIAVGTFVKISLLLSKHS